MGERFLEDSETRVPISSEPLPSAEEISRDITEMVGKFSGQALIDKLTEYCSLSVMEVFLLKDGSPNPLPNLKPEKIDVLKLLSPGLKPETGPE